MNIVKIAIVLTSVSGLGAAGTLSANFATSETIESKSEILLSSEESKNIWQKAYENWKAKKPNEINFEGSNDWNTFKEKCSNLYKSTYYSIFKGKNDNLLEIVEGYCSLSSEDAITALNKQRSSIEKDYEKALGKLRTENNLGNEIDNVEWSKLNQWCATKIKESKYKSNAWEKINNYCLKSE